MECGILKTINLQNSSSNFSCPYNFDDYKVVMFPYHNLKKLTN